MEYSFDIEHAKQYGVDEAIMIKNLQFWIMKNKASRKHEHDGRTWTYNTAEAFAELFPFWTPNQIRRILASLKDQGVIMVGNYNLTAYDRTSWYAFSDESIFIKSQIHFDECKNGSLQTHRPIPDSKPDNNPDNKRREEKREAVASPPPSPFRIGSDGTSRFERIKETSVGFPPIRKNLFELRDDDRREILATLSHYSDEEIGEALKTYTDMLKDDRYDIFAPYASLIGFLRSGVEKFVNESNPREVYLKRDPETLEKARRDAFFDNLKNKTDGGDDDDEQ